MLEGSGIDSIKIDSLAKKIGVSRSGFYWHFKNRKDLLQHLLDYWMHEYTGVLSNNSSLMKLTADKRLLKIMKLIKEHRLAKYDFAIIAWAKTDLNASAAVNKVMEMRLYFIRESFKELGFIGDELEMRTRLFVCYHSLASTIFEGHYTDETDNRLLLLHRFFTIT